ncbi:MAG: D-2-hydroxyacid dehydrogenase [Verrucomicrobiae bacterium]|nr:D-2-hydroxyacid dehydrogenase [Verrucomicrobiae bacterium]
MVILDTLGDYPAPFSWEPISDIAPCDKHERTPPDQTLARAANATILLTNKTPLPAEVIGALPRLSYIGVLATGYNVVDVAAARARGIPVTNVPEYGTDSVAQATFALLLELTNRVGHHAEAVRKGRWCEWPDFCFWDYPLIELAGRTLGVVGYGRIGRAVARIAGAFGMRVLASARAPRSHDGIAAPADIDTLFRESEAVSLHCPLTPETRQLVNAHRLAGMKPGSYLINTGRGALIDETALAEALESGRLAGAGLDVLATEPPRPDNPLLRAPNCIITPHVAWATVQARGRLVDIAAANIRAFLSGAPQNVVNA